MAIKKVKEVALAVPRVEEDWERQLRDKARQARAAETLGVPRVTYKGGILKINEEKVDGNRLSIVPLGLIYAKEYYAEEYRQGSSDTPVCYAFGRESDKGLVPHEQAPDKQADACDGCKHNRFGTAEKGRGKRCSDRRRVLFLLAGDLQKEGEEELAKAIAKAQHYQISVPPGSLRGFADYLDAVAGATPHGSIQEAVTEVTTTAQDTGAFTVDLRFLDVVPRAAMPYLLKRGERAFDLMAQPFPVIQQEEAKAPARPVKGQGARR